MLIFYTYFGEHLLTLSVNIENIRLKCTIIIYIVIVWIKEIKREYFNSKYVFNEFYLTKMLFVIFFTFIDKTIKGRVSSSYKNKIYEVILSSIAFP